MTIWADADSLAPAIRAIILRRHGKPVPNSKTNTIITVQFVSCKKLPEYRLLESSLFTIVEQKPNAADDFIFEHVIPGDILITRDLLLAQRALQKSVLVLNDRGTIWTQETIKERVSQRNYAVLLREAGIASSKIASGLSHKNIKRFADALDQTITASYKLFSKHD